MNGIVKITTPTARKEHVCCVCGKPIKKGEKYFNIAVKEGCKLVSKKTHYTCRLEQEKPTEAVPMTEEQFKQEMHNDSVMMLEKFSFQENMEIAFVPLIITEVAWYYAERTMSKAAYHKVSETVRLSRTVKNLHKEYEEMVAKDLDFAHRSHYKAQSKQFIEICQNDLTLLWFSVNQMLKNDWYHLRYLDMRTDAYCGVVMCELLFQHNKRIAKMVGERTGNFNEYNNPKIEALKDCLESYVSPAELSITGHVKTSLDIMKKNLKCIEFNLV